MYFTNFIHSVYSIRDTLFIVIFGSICNIRYTPILIADKNKEGCNDER